MHLFADVCGAQDGEKGAIGLLKDDQSRDMLAKLQKAMLTSL